MDRYTKVVLTVIAILLGALVLGRGQEANLAIGAETTRARPSWQNVEIISAARTGGFYVVDRMSGMVWHYETMSEKGFPIRRTGTSGRIEFPGDQVKDVKDDGVPVGK